jgi:hypothetical protein
LALIVLVVSIGGIAVLAVFLLDKDPTKFDRVFDSLLPLVGTWVGTILAFYFTRENYEAAGRQVSEITEKLTPIERLRAIPIISKMLKREQMVSLNITEDKPVDNIFLVGDILNTFKTKNINRLPILDENDHLRYIIHRSMIDKYLAQKALQPEFTTEQLNALTLKELLEEDAALRNLFETSFTVVRADANLAEAKIEMEKIKNCLDVFITIKGTKNEPVMGWLTNLIISENAKL